LASISLVETPQGMVLLCPPPRATLSSALKEQFVVVADRIQDPGNLGAILRSARAFGAGSVVATKGCVDAGNPKALRASAGVWPGLPVAEGVDSAKAVEELKKAGFRVIVAESGGGTDFRELDWKGRIALVIGSEAHGPDTVFLAQAHARALIPLAGAAAAVLLGEAFRQRGIKGHFKGDAGN